MTFFNDSPANLICIALCECPKIIHVTIFCCFIHSICIISANFTGKKLLALAVCQTKEIQKTFLSTVLRCPRFLARFHLNSSFVTSSCSFSFHRSWYLAEMRRQENFMKLTVNKLCIPEDMKEGERRDFSALAVASRSRTRIGRFH